jgi:transposase InsO family protein
VTPATRAATGCFWQNFRGADHALEWVDWFNNRRLLEPIDDIPPTGAEQRFYEAMDDAPIAT